MMQERPWEEERSHSTLHEGVEWRAIVEEACETHDSQEVAGLPRFHFYLHVINARASFQEAEDCETPPPHLAESCTILGALLT